MNWISVKNDKPKVNEIVVGLLDNEEPVIVRYEEDRYGPIWVELVEVDREMDREGLITHFLRLPPLPKG